MTNILRSFQGESFFFQVELQVELHNCCNASVTLLGNQVHIGANESAYCGRCMNYFELKPPSYPLILLSLMFLFASVLGDPRDDVTNEVTRGGVEKKHFTMMMWVLPSMVFVLFIVVVAILFSSRRGSNLNLS